jgi:hypothetical protein
LDLSYTCHNLLRIESGGLYNASGDRDEFTPPYLIFIPQVNCITQLVCSCRQKLFLRRMRFNFAECNDKEKVEVRLFPNPANPDAIAFSVNGPSSGSVDVNLYDAFGRKIEAQILTLPNCIFVPKTTLVSGIYYLIIQQDDWRKVLKVNVK